MSGSYFRDEACNVGRAARNQPARVALDAMARTVWDFKDARNLSHSLYISNYPTIAAKHCLGCRPAVWQSCYIYTCYYESQLVFKRGWHGSNEHKRR